MLQRFLFLQWKSFLRGAGFTAGLVQKIVLGFVWVYVSLVFIGLAFAAFYGVQDELGEDPLIFISGQMLYGFSFWVVMRYFFQKMPIMHIQPLLALPIKKKNIVHFGLIKTAFSFFNVGNLFFFVPFGIILLKEGYPLYNIIGWWVAIGSVILITNFCNVMINSIDRLLVAVAVVLLGLYTLQFFDIIDTSTWIAPLFLASYNQPLWALIPLGIMVLTYQWSFTYFKKGLFLDGGKLKAKQETHRAAELSWLDTFGRMAIFLRNDIRLIIRNKRARMTVWMGVAFLFYGLLLLNNAYSNPVWQIFIGIFVSGGFLFAFGQFVPSWDSSYYPLMMTQNIAYKEYLASKWWLISVGTCAGMILSCFYLFFGWEVYLAILAGGVYNIGVNAYLVLLSGAYTRTPIDLTSTRKAFGDKKSFNVTSALLSIPKIVLPMFIYYVGVLVDGKLLGIGFVALLGVLGYAFRNLVFDWIVSIYKHEKHKTLQAYKQKNA